MPSVNISDETYEKLQRVAATTGRTPDDTAEDLLQGPLCTEPLSADEWQRRWDELRARTLARIPPGISNEEIEADVLAAVNEVRAERRARSN